MKKSLLAAFLVAALPMFFASCSNEDDLPDVDYNVQFSGVTVDNATGTLYLVQGDTLKVESITVTNNESNKNAAITGAEYFWDYYLLGRSPLPPYGFKIATNEDTPLGAHDLTIRMGVVAVDKEPAVGILSYQVEVVPDSTALPL